MAALFAAGLGHNRWPQPLSGTPPVIYIGSFAIQSAAVLAPMAGISDLPFRSLCRRLGAGLATGEMLTAETRLWHTAKSRLRLPTPAGNAPCSVQIVGADPAQLASAARASVALGAQIVDINMGCPAKKVCRRAAGSALLIDEALVKEILTTVVKAVPAPVTLKMRTGTDPRRRNGVTVAKIAEDAGVQALTVHGRTRACGFLGEAEYDTIADIVNRVRIPVFANGDIASPESARRVLDQTGAAGVMIGRGAWGQPWLFRTISHYLATGVRLAELSMEARVAIIHEHVTGIHDHYARASDRDNHPTSIAVRFARKHMGWYLDRLGFGADVRRHFNGIDGRQEQLDFVQALVTADIPPDRDGIATVTANVPRHYAVRSTHNNKQEIAA